jgi:hypothetical protein
VLEELFAIIIFCIFILQVRQRLNAWMKIQKLSTEVGKTGKEFYFIPQKSGVVLYRVRNMLTAEK